MRIGLVGIFADDQDRAERFYTEVPGLQRSRDRFGPGPNHWHSHRTDFAVPAASRARVPR
jgi:catechol 2,3-dioxygenase-like lactoylglutathione lyase family enzyme